MDMDAVDHRLTHAWEVFHMGDKADVEKLRRALLVALQAASGMKERLDRVERIVSPIEDLMRSMIEERIAEIRL